MIRKKADKKVIVALSGGVDSAVTAALLKKQGFDVVGVFFNFASPATLRKRACSRSDAGEGRESAERVAKKLNIPLKIIDARKNFKKKIVDYFIAAYAKGVTPNPCVACNREMKFDLLLKILRNYKADYVATGHYARIARQSSAFSFIEQSSPNSSKPSFNYKLLEAKDKTKDQSYFLYRLTQKQLAKIIFPLGDLKKTEVKRMARRLKLPVSGDEESQDICFLSGGDINSFLKKFINPKPGNIVDEKGKILAKHKGLPFYTIGQRKGIEIGGSAAYFVIKKNVQKNELVVSHDQKKLFSKKLEVRQVNWIKNGLKFPLRAKVQIRYHSENIPAIIKKGKSGRLTVETTKPVRAVTPGQSAVFYQGKEVLGGGVIQ